MIDLLESQISTFGGAGGSGVGAARRPWGTGDGRGRWTGGPGGRGADRDQMGGTGIAVIME